MASGEEANKEIGGIIPEVVKERDAPSLLNGTVKDDFGVNLLEEVDFGKELMHFILSFFL